MVILNRSIPALFCLGALLAMPSCTQSSPGGQPTAQATPASVQKTQTPAPAPAPVPAQLAASESNGKLPAAAPATDAVQDPVLPGEESTLMRAPEMVADGALPDVPPVYNIVARPSELNLGEWGTNAQAIGKVTLVNTSDTAATITDCKTNCGCTTTNCPKGKTLNPGESTEVEVKVSTGAAAHPITKTVTFMIDGQPLRVAVHADVKDYVAIDPTRIDRAKSADGKITLTAKDGTAFKILSVSPSVVDGISTEAKAVHEVFMNWASWDELGALPRPMLTFSIDHPKVDKVQTFVTVNRKADAMKDLADKGIDNLPLAAPPAEQQLAVAIRYGDVEAIKTALAGVTDPATRDSMLAVAARQGSVVAVGLLLDAGANIESVDGRGRTPLMCAVQADKSDVLKALIGRGANVNVADAGDVTALARAAGPFGDAAMIQVLVAAGAKVNAVDKRGQTPLMWAARFGDAAKVNALLGAGADASVKDAVGKSALEYARGRADAAGAAISASLEKAAGSAGPG